MTNVNPSHVRRASALHAVEQLAALMAAEQPTAPAVNVDEVRRIVAEALDAVGAEARAQLARRLPHARPDVLTAAPGYVRTATCKALDAALKVCDVDGSRAVIVSGPSGSSKTFAARHAALRRDVPVYTAEVSAATTREDLIDRPWVADAGQLGYVEGPVVRAMRDGGTLILDEFDLAHPAVIGALHSALDRDASVRLSSGEQLRAAPGFRAILTCNGLRRDTGGSYSVQSISSALKGRALFVAADYLSEADEVAIYTAAGYDEAKSRALVRYLTEVRALFVSGIIDVPPSPRMGLRVLAALKSGCSSPAAWGMALLDACNKKQAGTVSDKFAALSATGVTL